MRTAIRRQSLDISPVTDRDIIQEMYDKKEREYDICTSSSSKDRISNVRNSGRAMKYSNKYTDIIIC